MRHGEIGCAWNVYCRLSPYPVHHMKIKSFYLLLSCQFQMQPAHRFELFATPYTLTAVPLYATHCNHYNRKAATDLHLIYTDRIPYAKSFCRYFGQFISIDQYYVLLLLKMTLPQSSKLCQSEGNIKKKFYVLRIRSI